MTSHTRAGSQGKLKDFDTLVFLPEKWFIISWIIYDDAGRIHLNGKPAPGGSEVKRSDRGRNDMENLPDWERLLAAERHIQHLVSGSVLVGGTAVALHAHHRQSLDADHVLVE